MLVYYFVPFIVSNRYLLFWVSNGHNSVTVQNRTHVHINFFDHKDLGNHLLQLCPKVVKHPVYNSQNNLIIYDVFYSKCSHQHISAGIPAIFRMALLQDQKSTNVVTCVTITPYQLKLKLVTTMWIKYIIYIYIYCSASVRYLYI